MRCIRLEIHRMRRMCQRCRDGSIENIGKLRKEDAFSAWMYRIVANMCKQKMREYYQRGEELTEENGGWDGYVWVIPVRNI